MPPLGANLPAGTFPMPVWGRQGKPAVYPLAFLLERAWGKLAAPLWPMPVPRVLMRAGYGFAVLSLQLKGARKSHFLIIS